jgi:hypothetical protein
MNKIKQKRDLSLVFVVGLILLSTLVMACDTTTGSDTAKKALAGTVSIDGTAKVGETLTANVGGLTNKSGTATYQWKRGTANIGANQNTYAIVAADVAGTITVTVSYSGNSGSITSNETSSIAAKTFEIALSGVFGDRSLTVEDRVGLDAASKTKIEDAFVEWVIMSEDPLGGIALNMAKTVLDRQITMIVSGTAAIRTYKTFTIKNLDILSDSTTALMYKIDINVGMMFDLVATLNKSSQPAKSFDKSVADQYLAATRSNAAVSQAKQLNALLRAQG